MNRRTASDDRLTLRLVPASAAPATSGDPRPQQPPHPAMRALARLLAQQIALDHDAAEQPPSTQPR